MGRPRKNKFPMGLEEWLRRILPEKRPEDRMKIFREWRRLNLSTSFKREPTDQELEEEIKLIRERKFGPGNYTFGYADSLSDFVPEFHKQNRIKRAQNAATERWVNTPSCPPRLWGFFSSPTSQSMLYADRRPKTQ